MGRRKYSREFKIEAVKLLESSGRTCGEVARELGVHPNTLGAWKVEYGEDPKHAFPGKGRLKPEDEEIRQLRREVERLRAERDILKEAAVFFAKESK